MEVLVDPSLLKRVSGSAVVLDVVALSPPIGCTQGAGLLSPPERVSGSAAVLDVVGPCPPIGCARGAGLLSPPEHTSVSAAVWNAVGLCPPIGCTPCAGLPSPPECVSGSEAVLGAVGLCPPIGCMPHVPPERVRGSAVGLGVMLLHPPVGCALCAGLPLLPEREGGSDAVLREGGFLGWARTLSGSEAVGVEARLRDGLYGEGLVHLLSSQFHVGAELEDAR